MSDTNIYRMPIVSLDDPGYAHLARRVAFPPSDKSQRGRFFPAFAGFNIGSGSDVDVSFLYGFNDEPVDKCDRHLRTEELFVVLDGSFCIPLAACKNADDPDEQPVPEDFVCALVSQGEAIVLRPNVWHGGGWPVDPKKGVRYIMVLSGHRAGAGHQGRVDHIGKAFPDNRKIIPNWDTVR